MPSCLLLTQSCADAGGLFRGPTWRAWGAPRFLEARGRSEPLDTGRFVSCGDQSSASFCSFLQFLAVLPLHAARSACGERAPRDASGESGVLSGRPLNLPGALLWPADLIGSVSFRRPGSGVTRATLSSGPQERGLHVLASRPAHTQTVPAPSVSENWHSDPLPGCLLNTHFK